MAVFITPVDVTPTDDATWQDVDVSAHVSADATGVMLEIVQSNSGRHSWGVRKNGSTDDFYEDAQVSSHMWAAVGIDASDIFEAKLEAAGTWTIYLHGYFEDDAVFFTNGVDKTPGSNSSFVDVDISTDTSTDTAIAGIFQVVDTSAATSIVCVMRKNGSTDDFSARATVRINHMLIGVDGSEIAEAYMSLATTTSSLYLIGYITKDGAWNTNAIENSLSSTATWVDLAALNDTEGVGACFQVVSSGGGDYDIRKNGASDETYERMPSQYGVALSEADASRICEGKIFSAVCDFYETGYFYDPSTARRHVQVTSS